MTLSAIDTRTDAEARADLTRRRNLHHLREAADAYEYQASISKNGGSVSNAHKFKDRVHAIRWALRELDPLTEGPRQVLDDMAKAAE